jgi:ferredoxin
MISVLQIDKNVCDACGTCISVCKENALKLIDTLTVDTDMCSLCGECVRVCSFAALAIIKVEIKEAAE